jgi:hypothetical protein
MHRFPFGYCFGVLKVFPFSFSSAGMYMQEALELVCRKRKLQNPNDYALLLADKSILIPLDRTVASLQGKRELLLVKRSILPQMDGVILKGIGKTTDPNGIPFLTTFVSILLLISSCVSIHLQTNVRYTGATDVVSVGLHFCIQGNIFEQAISGI